VGARQRTCGAAACRREQKRRSQASWSSRNPGYWTERRLRASAERLSAPGGLRRGDGALFRGPPSFLREIPSSLAQDAMSTQVLVLIAYLLRMQHRAAQDAMRSYILEHKGESGGLQASIGQDASAIEGAGP